MISKLDLFGNRLKLKQLQTHQKPGIISAGVIMQCLKGKN
jgi:hypothetical protein